MPLPTLKSRYDLLPAKAWNFYQENLELFIEQMILDAHTKKRMKDYYLSDQQKEAIRAFSVTKRLSIVSGKGCGKSAFLALLAIAFVSVFPEAQVVISAPTSKTLRSGLWKEMQKWIIGSHIEQMFEITSEKIYINVKDHCGDRFAPFIEMRTAAKGSPESLQGIHTENLLILIDEASLVDVNNFRALVDTLTGGPNNKVVATSNGTRNSGEFYDTQMNDVAGLWTKLKWSALDSPFTSKEQIRESEIKYGVDSDPYRINVLGLFPKSDPDSFLSYHDIVCAFDREVKGEGEIAIGVDVARFGDDKTVLFWRWGYKVYPPIYKGKTSMPEVVQMVFDLVTEIRGKTDYKNKIRVKVDDGGLGGSVTDYLELDRIHGIEVVPCNFGGKGNERYQDEATMMWASLRDVIDKVSLPNADEVKEEYIVNAMKEELSARRVKYDTGRAKIESKSVFKAEAGRSPDFADALVLCFFDKVARRSFLTSFDSQSKETVVDADMGYHGAEHYVSVFYSSTRLASIVWVYWSNGQLFIKNNLVTDDNIGRVAEYIRMRSATKPIKILGNDRCFGSNTEDISGQFRKQGIILRENYSFNELGAIELLNYIVANGNIKIARNCTDTIGQLNRWSVDLKSKELEENHGLCYAILNVVSLLKNKIKPQARVQIGYVPYGSTQTTLSSIDRLHCEAMF